MDRGISRFQALTPKDVCRKLARKKSWLWNRIKIDPSFPRPIYLAPSSPIFIESEIDTWVVAQRSRDSGRLIAQEQGLPPRASS